MLPEKKIVHPRNGFTFVEVLAAMLFMTIVIPVVMHALLLINRAGAAAARKREATELADRVLTEAVATESWRNGSLGGDFSDEAPGFRYAVTTTNWSEDALTLLTARVYYTVQDREYSEALSTLAFANEGDDANVNSSTSTGTSTGRATGTPTGSNNGANGGANGAPGGTASGGGTSRGSATR